MSFCWTGQANCGEISTHEPTTVPSARRWQHASRGRRFDCGRRQPADLQSAVPADQGAAHAKLAIGRMEAWRTDPQRGGTGCPLQGKPGHGAQGDRRAGGRKPGHAAPGQGHVRVDSPRGARPLPLSEADARRRRAAPSGQPHPRRDSSKCAGRGGPIARFEGGRPGDLCPAPDVVRRRSDHSRRIMAA